MEEAIGQISIPIEIQVDILKSSSNIESALKGLKTNLKSEFSISISPDSKKNISDINLSIDGLYKKLNDINSYTNTFSSSIDTMSAKSIAAIDGQISALDRLQQKLVSIETQKSRIHSQSGNYGSNTPNINGSSSNVKFDYKAPGIDQSLKAFDKFNKGATDFALSLVKKFEFTNKTIGDAFGSFSNGKIQINSTQNASKQLKTIYHELSHAFVANLPDQNAFFEVFSKDIAGSKTLQNIKSKVEKQYKDQLNGPNGPRILLEETLARAVELSFSNSGFREKIGGTVKNIINQLHKGIDDGTRFSGPGQAGNNKPKKTARQIADEKASDDQVYALRQRAANRGQPPPPFSTSSERESEGGGGSSPPNPPKPPTGGGPNNPNGPNPRIPRATSIANTTKALTDLFEVMSTGIPFMDTFTTKINTLFYGISGESARVREFKAEIGDLVKDLNRLNAESPSIKIRLTGNIGSAINSAGSLGAVPATTIVKAAGGGNPLDAILEPGNEQANQIRAAQVANFGKLNPSSVLAGKEDVGHIGNVITEDNEYVIKYGNIFYRIKEQIVNGQKILTTIEGANKDVKKLVSGLTITDSGAQTIDPYLKKIEEDVKSRIISTLEGVTNTQRIIEREVKDASGNFSKTYDIHTIDLKGKTSLETGFPSIASAVANTNPENRNILESRISNAYNDKISNARDQATKSSQDLNLAVKSGNIGFEEGSNGIQREIDKLKSLGDTSIETSKKIKELQSVQKSIENAGQQNEVRTARANNFLNDLNKYGEENGGVKQLNKTSFTGLTRDVQTNQLATTQTDVKKIGDEYIRVTQVINQAGQVIDVTTKSLRSHGEAMREVAQLSGGLTRSFLSLVETAGKVILSYQTAHLVFSALEQSIVKSIQTAGEFEQSQFDIKKILDESNPALATRQLREDAVNKTSEKSIELSRIFGVSATQVMGIQRDWIALFGNQTDATNATVSALKLAASTSIDLADSSKVLVAVAQQFGLSAKGVDDFVDSLNEVTNRLPTVDPAQLAENLQRVGSIAKESGVSVDKTLALLAVGMEKTGAKAAEVGNALKAFFTSLNASDKKQNVLAGFLGISPEQLGNINVNQSIDLIQKKVSEVKRKVLTLNSQGDKQAAASAEGDLLKFFAQFGGAYQGNRLLSIFSSEARFNKIYDPSKDRITNSQGSAAKEAATQLQSFEQTRNRFEQSLNVLAVRLGNSVLPAIKSIMEQGIVLFTTLDQNRGIFEEGFKKLYNVIQPLGSLLGGIFKGIYEVLQPIGSSLVKIGEDLLDIVSSVGKGITAVNQWAKAWLGVDNAIQSVGVAIGSLAALGALTSLGGLAKGALEARGLIGGGKIVAEETEKVTTGSLASEALDVATAGGAIANGPRVAEAAKDAVSVEKVAAQGSKASKIFSFIADGLTSIVLIGPNLLKWIQGVGESVKLSGIAATLASDKFSFLAKGLNFVLAPIIGLISLFTTFKSLGVAGVITSIETSIAPALTAFTAFAAGISTVTLGIGAAILAIPLLIGEFVLLNKNADQLYDDIGNSVVNAQNRSGVLGKTVSEAPDKIKSLNIDLENDLSKDNITSDEKNKLKVENQKTINAIKKEASEAAKGKKELDDANAEIARIQNDDSYIFEGSRTKDLQKAKSHLDTVIKNNQDQQSQAEASTKAAIDSEQNLRGSTLKLQADRTDALIKTNNVFKIQQDKILKDIKLSFDQLNNKKSANEISSSDQINILSKLIPNNINSLNKVKNNYIKDENNANKEFDEASGDADKQEKALGHIAEAHEKILEIEGEQNREVREYIELQKKVRDDAIKFQEIKLSQDSKVNELTGDTLTKSQNNVNISSKQLGLEQDKLNSILKQATDYSKITDEKDRAKSLDALQLDYETQKSAIISQIVEVSKQYSVQLDAQINLMKAAATILDGISTGGVSQAITQQLSAQADYTKTIAEIRSGQLTGQDAAIAKTQAEVKLTVARLGYEKAIAEERARASKIGLEFAGDFGRNLSSQIDTRTAIGNSQRTISAANQFSNEGIAGVNAAGSIKLTSATQVTKEYLDKYSAYTSSLVQGQGADLLNKARDAAAKTRDSSVKSDPQLLAQATAEYQEQLKALKAQAPAAAGVFETEVRLTEIFKANATIEDQQLTVKEQQNKLLQEQLEQLQLQHQLNIGLLEDQLKVLDLQKQINASHNVETPYSNQKLYEDERARKVAQDKENLEFNKSQIDNTTSQRSLADTDEAKKTFDRQLTKLKSERDVLVAQSTFDSDIKNPFDKEVNDRPNTINIKNLESQISRLGNQNQTLQQFGEFGAGARASIFTNNNQLEKDKLSQQEIIYARQKQDINKLELAEAARAIPDQLKIKEYREAQLDLARQITDLDSQKTQLSKQINQDLVEAAGQSSRQRSKIAQLAVNAVDIQKSYFSGLGYSSGNLSQLDLSEDQAKIKKIKEDYDEKDKQLKAYKNQVAATTGFTPEANAIIEDKKIELAGIGQEITAIQATIPGVRKQIEDFYKGLVTDRLQLESQYYDLVEKRAQAAGDTGVIGETQRIREKNQADLKVKNNELDNINDDIAESAKRRDQSGGPGTEDYQRETGRLLELSNRSGKVKLEIEDIKGTVDPLRKALMDISKDFSNDFKDAFSAAIGAALAGPNVQKINELTEKLLQIENKSEDLDYQQLQLDRSRTDAIVPPSEQVKRVRQQQEFDRSQVKLNEERQKVEYDRTQTQKDLNIESNPLAKFSDTYNKSIIEQRDKSAKDATSKGYDLLQEIISHPDRIGTLSNALTNPLTGKDQLKKPEEIFDSSVGKFTSIVTDSMPKDIASALGTFAAPVNTFGGFVGKFGDIISGVGGGPLGSAGSSGGLSPGEASVTDAGTIDSGGIAGQTITGLTNTGFTGIANGPYGGKYAGATNFEHINANNGTGSIDWFAMEGEGDTHNPYSTNFTETNQTAAARAAGEPKWNAGTTGMSDEMLMMEGQNTSKREQATALGGKLEEDHSLGQTLTDLLGAGPKNIFGESIPKIKIVPSEGGGSEGGASTIEGGYSSSTAPPVNPIFNTSKGSFAINSKGQKVYDNGSIYGGSGNLEDRSALDQNATSEAYDLAGNKQTYFTNRLDKNGNQVKYTSGIDQITPKGYGDFSSGALQAGGETITNLLAGNVSGSAIKSAGDFLATKGTELIGKNIINSLVSSGALTVDQAGTALGAASGPAGALGGLLGNGLADFARSATGVKDAYRNTGDKVGSSIGGAAGAAAGGLAGAGEGAIIGTAIFPGPGTVIGGAIGGLAGAAAGAFGGNLVGGGIGSLFGGKSDQQVADEEQAKQDAQDKADQEKRDREELDFAQKGLQYQQEVVEYQKQAAENAKINARAIQSTGETFKSAGEALKQDIGFISAESLISGRDFQVPGLNNIAKNFIGNNATINTGKPALSGFVGNEGNSIASQSAKQAANGGPPILSGVTAKIAKYEFEDDAKTISGLVVKGDLQINSPGSIPIQVKPQLDTSKLALDATKALNNGSIGSAAGQSYIDSMRGLA